jgi:hypothetical protein
MIIGGSLEYSERKRREDAELRAFAEKVTSWEWRERVASAAEAAEYGLGRRRTDHVPERHG